ncbi:MAG: response regulator [Lachnospiraceae bacterium]|nr:response regulator [Lachnospiraceae bacterium]
MSYNALITGNNTSVIDDFFLRLQDDFEILTTSSRLDDISQHLKYFTPDVFVYCINNNYFLDAAKVVSTKVLLDKHDIPFVLIGSRDACAQFHRAAVKVADLTLTKPMSVSVIRDRMIDFLKKRQNPEEEATVLPDNSPVSETVNPNPQQTEAVPEPQQAETVPAPQKMETAPEPQSTDAVPKPQNTETEVTRKHVLVVDDNSLMLKVIKEHLRDDYDVATAISGKIALRFLQSKKTDLILLDYEMPEEDGPTILGKIRAMDSVKDVPVLFLTGISEKAKIQKALSMKPQGYLLKPIDRQNLLDAIHKYLG